MFVPTQKEINPIVAQFGSPIFVTQAQTIRDQCAQIISAFKGLNVKMFYAVKANFNPSVVKVIKDSGIFGIDAVSPNEVRLALDLGYQPDQIIFTPSNPSTAEIEQVAALGVTQNLGALSELRRLGEVAPGNEVSIRICPEVGGGEFDKINTGGLNTKFGISLNDLEEVKNICKAHNLSLIGIHSHIGSGFYEPDSFAASVQAVCDVAQQFLTIKFIDFGGGFGVSYHPDKPDINLKEFADSIKPIVKSYEKKTGKPIELRLEPGKFLVSQSTALCMKVTTLKQKHHEKFVGVDAGFSNYIRPAMYGAYQHFVNISNLDRPLETVKIAGNVCETCDIFNEGIKINEVREGDILAMLVAGGYGSSMSSNYNLRPTIPEVMIDGEQITLTRRKQNYTEIMQTFV